MSKKEKLLKKLSKAELLELTKTIPDAHVHTGITKHELVEILKVALSIEEIKRKWRESRAQVRKKNQFLAVLAISLLAYVSLIIGSASVLKNVNLREIPVGVNWSRNYDVRVMPTEFSVDTVKGTLDGGYVMIGWDISSGQGWSNYLLKTDSTGNVQWKSLATDEIPSFVDQTSDGGFLIGGTFLGFPNDYNPWVAEFDSNGTYLWFISLWIGNITVYSVHQTSDNGYIIAGATAGVTIPNSWVGKTDQNWNMLWNLTFGYGYPLFAQETPDAGYIIAEGQSGRILLVKTDSSGSEQWSRWLQVADGNVSANCMEQTSDGGFIIAGTALSYGSESAEDFWLGKVDQYGNMEWESTYGGSDSDIASFVQQTSDGGYILAGVTYPAPTGSPRSVLLVKTDLTGNLQWESVYVREGDNNAFFVEQRPDGRYVVAGGSPGSQYLWLDGVEPVLPFLLLAIPEALACSGLAVAACLLLMWKRLKRVGKESPMTKIRGDKLTSGEIASGRDSDTRDEGDRASRPKGELGVSKQIQCFKDYI